MESKSLVTRSEITSLARSLAQGWWIFAARGLASLAFGAVAVIWPAHALSTITIVFGLYALFDAAAAFVSLLLGQGGRRQRWWLGVIATAGAFAGLAVFVWPDLAALLVVYLIAAWACVSGLLQVAGGIALRREIEGEWLLVMTGTLAALFGAVLFALAGAGLPALASIVGIYSLAYGTAMLAIAVALRAKRPHLIQRNLPTNARGHAGGRP